MALQDFPELKATFDALSAEKAQLVARAAPLREAREKLREQIAPLEVQEREMIKQYRAIEQPRLADIDYQLAVIARATGGASLQTTPDGTAPA